MAQDRTEQPTARRLRDARKKGQLARSREVVGVAQLAAVLVVLVWAGRYIVEGLGLEIVAGIERMGQSPLRTLSPGDLVGLAVSGAKAIGLYAGPVALASAVAVVAASVAQGGWNVASEALALKWSNLSPMKGLGKLKITHSGPLLGKILLGLTALVWLSSGILVDLAEVAPWMLRLPAIQTVAFGWGESLRLVKLALVVLVVIAAADYGVTRWQHQKSLKMTKQEVKDDLKLTEGNPEIKARLRRAQRDAARRRMMADVPKATVVITNPTHYAVALEYRRETMVAPRVVAKGRNLIAAKIREIARAHDVPIVENVPLAQSLYKATEVGETIPGELFGAVAEVLAYLIRLKQFAR
jgi:flagellar biosynthesis protein FlhB